MATLVITMKKLVTSRGRESVIGADLLFFGFIINNRSEMYHNVIIYFKFSDTKAMSGFVIGNNRLKGG